MVWVRIVGINILVFAILIGAVEAILTVMNRCDPSKFESRSIKIREWPHLYEKKMIISENYLASTDGLNIDEVDLRIDSRGAIEGVETSLIQTPEQERTKITFIGGSTTESLYVSAVNRFPAKVEVLLSEKFGIASETFNFGYSGSHSLHNAAVLLAKVVPLEPDYVFIMNAINDISLLSKTGSYFRAPDTRSFIEGGAVRCGSDNPIEVFRIYPITSIVPQITAMVQRSLIKKTEVDEFEAFRDYKTDIHKMKKILNTEYKSSIASLVEIARSWSISPVLMTQMHRISDDEFFLKAQFEKFEQPLSWSEIGTLQRMANQIVRELAYEKNVPLVDLERLVPSNNLYIYDSVHLNDKGSFMVGELIAEKIKMLEEIK